MIGSSPYLALSSQTVLDLQIIQSDNIKPLEMNAKKLTSHPKLGSKTVPLLPNSQSVPLWLLLLRYWQRNTSVVTFILVTTTLTVYGWTVYSQQRWSQEYRKLVTLQRDERQLTTTTELMKNNMALEAEKAAAGLAPPNPAQTIFLTLPPQHSGTAANSVVSATKPASDNQTRLGY